MAGDEVLLPAASLMIHLYFCRKSVPHCLPSSQCFPDYAISTRGARALSTGRLEFPQFLIHCQEGKATLMEIENQQEGKNTFVVARRCQFTLHGICVFLYVYVCMQKNGDERWSLHCSLESEVEDCSISLSTRKSRWDG